MLFSSLCVYNNEMNINEQVCWLFILAIPVACISWTVTHEEIFKGLRSYCEKKTKSANIFVSKFFYLFICEFCFSHYVTILFLFLTNYQLLLTGWKGFIIGGFSLVWIANIYMNIFSYIRQDIKKVKEEIKDIESK